MKSINTLSIFITLCLTLLVTLLLSTATVRAAELPKAQLEKVELVNKATFSQQAIQDIASSMADLQLAVEINVLEGNTFIAKHVKNDKVNDKKKAVQVAYIAE
jgi:hypothetical protein